MKFCITFVGCLFLMLTKIYGQCPENIGFEYGYLANWQCYVGSIDPKGVISLSPSATIDGRHTITFPRNNSIKKDPYGSFPTICPNGGRYSLKLGNEQSGAEAERVSYTFSIPANRSDFTITYNYAVVFQNPTDHEYFEQPKFTAKVFDVVANKYLDCGSFEFVASSNLPGFQQIGDVYFKPWSPITIDLKGYQGKTLRLEFTTNDCTRGSHFGYAYVDVDENCTSPIKGNIYCADKTEVNLSVPPGVKEYYWYNAQDFSKILGTTNTLKIFPLPPDGTRYALRLVPYPGLGCEDTLYTNVSKSKEGMNLVVQDSVSGCEFTGVNFKSGDITKGSSTNLIFSYYLDPEAQNYIQDPYNIKKSGTYYIKGENSDGCFDIKPIVVTLETAPSISITNPPPVCSPEKVDLSQNNIIGGSTSNLTYSYWKDAQATVPVPAPKQIDSAGTYYIKGTNSTGCYQIVPVIVQISHQPNLTVNKATGCTSVNLTAAAVTAGSDLNLTYSYWQDAAATIALSSPDKITIGGTFYIKAVNFFGCSRILPVNVQISAPPNFQVIKTAPVNFPATVNITNSYNGNSNLVYTFWRNSDATIPLDNPAAVQKSGTYFIKATNAAGCALVLPVVVQINPAKTLEIIAVNTFSPNNDGINDFFKITAQGTLQLNYLRIFNRYGQQVFETRQIDNFWDGTYNGRKTPVGTYYWVLDGTDTYRKARVTKSGSITVIR